MAKKWTAQVQVKWTKDAPVWENWNWLKKWKEVKWAASTMGEWDMILWVDCDSPAALEKFVHEKLWPKNGSLIQNQLGLKKFGITGLRLRRFHRRTFRVS